MIKTRVSNAVLVVLLFAGSSLYAQNPKVQEYILQYRELAIREMQRSGVPASIKLAQGILETEAGRSDLVLRSNNHFGIKCKSNWSGEKVYHDDDARGECFRKYENAEASWQDHSNFLRNSPRYASLFQLDPTDYKAWAWGLKKAGYATNPKYAQMVIRYIEEYGLNDYSLIALGRKPMPDDIVFASAKTPGPSAEVNNTLDIPAVSEQPATPVIKRAIPKRVAPQYPSGEFRIHDTRVIFAPAGTSLLQLADKYGIRYKHILEFNDRNQDQDLLTKDELVYLQRKRRFGKQEFHVVAEGETLHDIAQEEGMRLENLLDYNMLGGYDQPAPGEKLYLQGYAFRKPMLVQEWAMLQAKEEMASPKAVNPDPFESGGSPMGPDAPVQVLSHTVKPRETLYSLARQYQVTVQQIRDWNRLDSDALRIGQIITIQKSR